MKFYLTKLRISAALDSGRPLPESLQRKITAEPELERFVRCAKSMTGATQVCSTPDPDFQADIMRAVRASARSGRSEAKGLRGQIRPSFWLPAATAVTAMVAFGFLIYRPKPEGLPVRSLQGPALVLDMSEQIPATMPALVMSPLSNEWARVNHDVQGTTQILLASFP